MGGALSQFLADLKRRHIYRVAAVYAVVAWILIQLIGALSDMLRLPEWAGSFVLVLLLVCFPLVLIFAWVHDLPAAAADVPAAAATKLDWVLALCAAFVALGLVYQLVVGSPDSLQAATIAPQPPGSISIAVLPLANTSGDPSQEFLSDGITDEINSALARVPTLRLVGRSSAFQFKGQGKDLRAIGQTLGATYLIDGSVRRAGNRVRVTAALITANDGISLWTDSYEHELTDVFAIQEDIAQAIAAALRAPLGLEVGERLISSRTADADSYQDYLRGRALVRNRVLDQAITTLEAAVARDPQFAPAWAMLSQAQRALLEYSPVSRRPDIPVDDARAFVQETLDKSERAARRAIELDPRHDGGYAALGYVEATRGHWKEADELFAQALALDSNNPEALYRHAQLLSLEGRISDSLRAYEQLLAIEPLVPIYRFQTGHSLYVNGRNQASIAMLDASSDESPARYYRNYYRAMAHAAVGRYAEAAEALASVRGEPQVSPEVIDRAVQLIRAPMPVDAPESLPALGDFAFVYTYVGAEQRRLEQYERGQQIGNAATLQSLWNPEDKRQRSTERFKRLVREFRLVEYWREEGWPDLCRPVGADDFACD
jgi:TolB-like protein